ncbi:hypothetical protein [Geomonas subterranea]|uniref:Uncharacterized protein n=1 Tax=Geomonas subterranea TaxID=2847989 RepID=A0ABX8LEM4_9BACT|nr:MULTISPECIES: hypothetical protein [Geomonas]QXE90122.1 hypothetical protein KP001_17125 [Geomonas subterranea]QXM07753.1 hypothetical protein KP002_12155 [Geomonas subterranea]
MVMVYLALALCGVGLIAWGLPAAHRLRSPLNVVAAASVLLGVLLALLGTLLFVAPNFFQG